VQAERAPRFRGSARFQVVRQIGQGGAGSVYEAVDKESGTHVALKTLNAPDAESIRYLKHEFRSIQDLAHPNLVTPQELFEAQGEWFFSMEYVEGADFLAHVRPGPEPRASEATLTARQQSGEREIAPRDTAVAAGMLDLARLRAALGQLAVGVCALHADHKVHRDLKPSNVLVDPQGRVRILDFGVVWDLAMQRRLEEEGTVVGTIAYMAPEQGGGEAVTPACDWYAVGVMLYQALTGQLPFTGTVANIFTRKSSAEPPPPASIAPGVPEDLDALCVDLLRIDPAARPEGPEVLRRLGVRAGADLAAPGHAAGFVGRGPELAALDAAYAEVAAGRTVTVLVEGESGVGKSALVRELAARVAGPSTLVLHGRCYERESVPYKGVDALIDDLAQYLASLREDEAAALLPDRAPLLRTLFPVLDAVPAVRDARATRSEVRNPQEARAQMFALLRSLLVNVALYRRLVLVVDDLQWADADSLALLADVLRPPNAPPLLLLASIRSATTRAPRGASVQDRLADFPGDVRWIHLEPLGAEAARDLARELLARASGGEAAADEVEAICAEAKGHPLFLDELVRHRATREAAAPMRLDDALVARAARLAPAARKVLELVAVAGVPVTQQVAGAAAALDPAQLFDAVCALRAGRFVRTTGAYRHDTVDAYHDRVRRAVGARLEARERKDWHGRIALALEQTGETDARKLVTHWLGAGEKARAATYAVRAADQAAEALAFDHAASLYRLALDQGTVEGEAATALRVKAAEALTNAGHGAEAAALYLEAAGGGDSDAALDLRRRAADELCCSGRNAEGGETIASVLRAVGVWAPRRPLAIILTFLFYSVVLAVRGLKFRPRRASELPPRTLLRLDVLDSAGTSIGMSDHVRGKMFQVRTLVEALALGEPVRVARSLAYYAAGHASDGEAAYAKAMAMQELVAAMAEESRNPQLRALAWLVEGFACFLSGRIAESCVPFVHAETVFREECVGVAYELAAIRSLFYGALGYTGELDELAARAEQALREAEQRGDLYAQAIIRVNAVLLLALARDDADEAEWQLARAAEQLPKGTFLVQTFYWLVGTAQRDLYVGEPARGLARLEEHAAPLRRSLLLRVQRVRVLVHDARARLGIAALAAGATAPAREAIEADVRALEREGLPITAAHAHALRAGLASLDRDDARARAELEAAEKGFDALKMALYAAAARRQRGVMLGGDEGRALVESADAAMAARGVKSPAKLAAMYVPGFAR
jgi:hypothetical protein